jgi:hypothetical protein
VLANDLARREALAADNARLYSQAQDAVRLRDEFLSVASHELRTPLTPLNLKLGMLRKRAEEASGGLVPAARVESDVTTAARHVQRLSELVDHLLDVTRIRAGAARRSSRWTWWRGGARRAVRFAAVAADVHSPIELDLPPTCIGRWDRVRLEQVITNLLSNALKFGAGLPVLVKVAREGERVVLVVKDSGIGMDEAMLARVFGRFERGPSSRNYAGLGLGLSTKQIVVASTAPSPSERGGGRSSPSTAPSPEGASLTPRAGLVTAPHRSRGGCSATMFPRCPGGRRRTPGPPMSVRQRRPGPRPTTRRQASSLPAASRVDEGPAARGARPAPAPAPRRLPGLAGWPSGTPKTSRCSWIPSTVS